VLLTGVAGDAAVALSPGFWVAWLRGGEWRRLASAQAHAWRLSEGRPRLFLRSGLRAAARSVRPRGSLPAWMRPELAERVAPAVRSAALRAGAGRPIGLAAIAESPLWPAICAQGDAGFTGVPLAIRSPFFDLRLLRFLDSVPPVPLLDRKALLREAARGLLPEPVRQRPKVPLGRDPRIAALRRHGAPAWMLSLAESGLLDRWVDPAGLGRVLRQPGQADDAALRLALSAVELAYWLAHRDRAERRPAARPAATHPRDQR
jgi:asparagine synthase (glutamine-hydrolysing)